MRPWVVFVMEDESSSSISSRRRRRRIKSKLLIHCIAKSLVMNVLIYYELLSPQATGKSQPRTTTST